VKLHSADQVYRLDRIYAERVGSPRAQELTLQQGHRLADGCAKCGAGRIACNDSTTPKCRRCGEEWIRVAVDVPRDGRRRPRRQGSADRVMVEKCTTGRLLDSATHLARRAYTLYMEFGRAKAAEMLGVSQGRIGWLVTQARRAIELRIDEARLRGELE
jgi:hypothetical protein